MTPSMSKKISMSRRTDSCSRSRREARLEAVQDVEKLRGQPLSYFLYDRLGHPAPVRFGDGPRDAGHGIGVAAERDGVAHSALEIRRVEKTDDRFQHGALCRDIEGIPRTDGCDGAVEVIADARVGFPADLLLRGPRP